MYLMPKWNWNGYENKPLQVSVYSSCQTAELFLNGKSLGAAILSFVFGAMMFFAPAIGARIIGLAATPETESVLRGLGGLIIGSGTINLLFRNQNDIHAVKALLITNIITHLLGILADVRGVLDGVLTTSKIAL